MGHKQAISVTLDPANLTWLKARAGAIGVRSVSELLDRLIADARSKGSAGPARSVVGTIDIDVSDPLLIGADDTIRTMFDASTGRALLEKQDSPNDRPARRRGRRRRG